jgi:hypothetical protein
MAVLQDASASLKGSFVRMGNTVHSLHSNTKWELGAEKPKPSAAAALHKRPPVELRTPLVANSSQQNKDSHSQAHRSRLPKLGPKHHPSPDHKRLVANHRHSHPQLKQPSQRYPLELPEELA